MDCAAGRSIAAGGIHREESIIMSTFKPFPGALWRATTARLEGLGQWLAPLGLRLIMACVLWRARQSDVVPA
jgi:hypothetical protein